MACQFVFLEAELLAAVQVLVYVGAVAILMMFGIMLTRNIQGDDTTTVSCAMIGPAAVAVIGLFCILLYGINDHNGLVGAARPLGRHQEPSPGFLGGDNAGPAVGRELVNRYAVAFEVAGLMLTAALVGAVALAHRDAEDEAADRNDAAAVRGPRDRRPERPRSTAGDGGFRRIALKSIRMRQLVNSPRSSVAETRAKESRWATTSR